MNIKHQMNRALNFAKWLVLPGDYRDEKPDSIINIRKRKTRYVMLAGFVLFIVLFMATLFLSESEINTPISNNILVAISLNFGLILVLVLLLLVARNIIKLYFERRGGIAGSRFQARLVIAFLSLTLIPSILVFTVASELLSDTIDKWINSPIEQTLHESVAVAEALYKNSEKQTMSYAAYVAGLIHRGKLLNPDAREVLKREIQKKTFEYDVDVIQVYNSDFEIIEEARKDNAFFVNFDLRTELNMLAKVAMGEAVSSIEDVREENHVVSMVPILIRPKGKPSHVLGVVVVIKTVSRRLLEKVQGILEAFQDYKQLRIKKEMIKDSYQLTLATVALVLVFSSIWFGFYIAKGITVPLKLLAEATEAVAKGNLDIQIDLPNKGDEAAQLVGAFNKMTLDLKNSKEQVERINVELSESNTELYHWGQYIEAILENFGGGIFSLDKLGVVTTINESAAHMFGIEQDKSRGQNFNTMLEPKYLSPVRNVVREMSEQGEKTIVREINLLIDNKKRILKAGGSVLTDHLGQYVGMVFVFDDITDLIGAQRTIAWREMARAIAHEIKNPLTPIQLNTQRLRRKYEQNAADFPKALDDATNIIIQEVEQLKALVDKFRQFSESPESYSGPLDPGESITLGLRPEPTMLHDIIFEVVKLYQNTRQNLLIETELDSAIQLVTIDAEQFRRALINLVENAMDSIGEGGLIIIRTIYDSARDKVVIEVIDNGHGVSEKDKEKIFQSYFSTKAQGTGLGLAIASQVVVDHGGTIKVSDNKPTGAVFTIELSSN
ncbi:MAG TPA: ATP-binding protein [Nitrospinota bacterium]|nr:ATP-binding protein [Nitrospinota bacterium]